jgi:hypothetical protein
VIGNVMNKEWHEQMVGWLKQFQWIWFCSLTLRPGLRERQARWRLRWWMAELRAALGTNEFGWVAAREYGRTRQDLHYHALVKGLSDWHAPERLDWMRRWGKFAGDARIDPFTPDAGGVEYILKDADPANPDAMEIEIQNLLFPETKTEPKASRK